MKNIVYRNIIAEMARNGFSRVQTAEKLGITVSSFRKKLAGITDFKISEVDLLISLFGNNVSYDYLLERSEGVKQ